MAKNKYILQIHCPDQTGLIAGTTQVLAKAGANIIDLQQHTAKDIETFFLRAVFEMKSDDVQEIYKHLETLEGHLKLNWKLFDTSKTERVAIFVSKTDHCLYDLLLKQLDKFMQEGFLRPFHHSLLISASTLDELFEKLDAYENTNDHTWLEKIKH